MRAGVLSGSCLLAFSAACDDGSDPPPIVDDLALTVDAATVTGTLAPLWRDHYDLSWQHFALEQGGSRNSVAQVARGDQLERSSGRGSSIDPTRIRAR